MIKITVAALSILTLTSCEGLLDEEVFSELSPGNFLTTEDGILSILMGGYGELQINNFGREYFNVFNEFPTDLAHQDGGGYAAFASLYESFQWESSESRMAGFWQTQYQAIRNANVVLDNLESAQLSEASAALYAAEARFIRATAYTRLYYLFGAVPLITSSERESYDQPRSSPEELLTFVEAELRASAATLPVEPVQYGRATKGASLGVLSEFLMNTRQWQKAADAAWAVMDLGVYGLFPDRYELWHVDNERNVEFIWVSPATRLPNQGNIFLSASTPAGYVFEFPPKESFANKFLLRSSFVDSFHPDDRRKQLILTEFINAEGETIVLPWDGAFSHKYREDPEASDRWAGNDLPEIRYADILLLRAEALNELQGPNQESIDLINRVRVLAEVSLLNLADFPSQESLRDTILQERMWEFFSEGKRRMDLIRQGRFIENARDRGIDAQPHHVVFPIPQVEIDSNSAIEQNPGY